MTALALLALGLHDLLDAVLEGRVRQGPLAQAVLAYEVLKHRGTLDAR